MDVLEIALVSGFASTVATAVLQLIVKRVESRQAARRSDREGDLAFHQQLFDENRHLREELDLARKHNAGLWVEVDAARREKADCERRLLDCQQSRREGDPHGNLGRAGEGLA